MGYPQATYTRLTASGLVRGKPGILRGFYVSSTSSGTITFYDNTAGSGTQITGTITPSVGWNDLGDVSFVTGCYAVISGTLDVTVSTWA